MNRLKNKGALITAGGSGIGRATCLLFAREGAKGESSFATGAPFIIDGGYVAR